MNITPAKAQINVATGLRALPSLEKAQGQVDVSSAAEEPKDVLSPARSYQRNQQLGRAVALGAGAAVGIAAGLTTALANTGTAVATGAGVLGLIGVGVGVFAAGLSGMGAPGTQVSPLQGSLVFGGIGAGLGAVAGAIGGPVGGLGVGLVAGAAGYLGTGLLWSKATGEI